MECELCKNPDAEKTEFGVLCEPCYNVQLTAHLQLLEDEQNEGSEAEDIPATPDDEGCCHEEG